MPKDPNVVTLGYSAMKKYLACSWQYHVSTGPDKVTVVEDMRGRVKGLTAGKLLEDWIKLGTYPSGWMVEHCKTYWDHYTFKAPIRWRDTSDRQTMYQTLLQGVEAMERHWLSLGLVRWTIQAEVPITCTLPEKIDGLTVKLRGRLDLDCVSEKHGSVVGDLKFTNNVKYCDPDQLRFYCVLKKFGHGVDVKKAFNFLPYRKQPFIPWPMDDAYHKTFELVVHTIRGIRDGRFIPEGSQDDCFWCQYKSYCPKFKVDIGKTGVVSIGEDPTELFGDLL